jgi:hypothetical protein
MTGFSIKRLQEIFRKQQPGLRKDDLDDHRIKPRYRSFARVKFYGQTGEESLLKDISVTGCCVECTSLAAIQPDALYTMEVIPEDAAKIGRFDLAVKTIWVQPSGYSVDVGFNITASPKGRVFQRYVDYLSWREDNMRQPLAN